MLSAQMKLELKSCSCALSDMRFCDFCVVNNKVYFFTELCRYAGYMRMYRLFLFYFISQVQNAFPSCLNKAHFSICLSSCVCI
jgi:hypothetical protein